MARFRLILAIVILAASIVLLFDRLSASQPIEIILETGQEVTTQSPEYFSLNSVLLLITTAFLIGLTASYLYHNSETRTVLKSFRQEARAAERYAMVMPLLKGDERKVFTEIIGTKGDILQNALVLKTGLSKVKVTRMLASLERKNLIAKERHGLTNRIVLEKGS